MAAPEKVRGRVIDAHSHIGEMDAWAFYNLKEPVKPTVYEFADAAAYLGHLDGLGVERAQRRLSASGRAPHVTILRVKTGSPRGLASLRRT